MPITVTSLILGPLVDRIIGSHLAVGEITAGNFTSMLDLVNAVATIAAETLIYQLPWLSAGYRKFYLTEYR